MAANLETVEQVENVIAEVEAAFFDIPFENSAFQTEAFVIAAAITPERAYRSIGLRMATKIQALQEAKFSRMQYQVDVDEIDDKIANGDLDSFAKRRELIKREKAQSDARYTNKLINDAITELNVLYKHFKALPKFTRAQFESGEYRHFAERLKRQQLPAPTQSIINMNEDVLALERFETATQDIELIEDETLENLRISLDNFIQLEQGEKQ